jgi:hypothetical protein
VNKSFGGTFETLIFIFELILRGLMTLNFYRGYDGQDVDIAYLTKLYQMSKSCSVGKEGTY